MTIPNQDTDTNMAIFGAGMTGSQFLTALNIQIAEGVVEGSHNVMRYGARGDGATNDTEAIQDAIDDCTTNGGWVYLPAGTYLTNTLTLNSKVFFSGDGKKSILKSAAAEPLFTLINDADDTDRWSLRIKGLQLDGNSIGTIGLNFYRYSLFRLSDLFIHDFTQAGIYGNGFLIGMLDNVYIKSCVIGIHGIKLMDLPESQPNLVTFINCKIDYNSSWGVKWEQGWLITFMGCNLEHNGTNGNAATGAISYTSGQSIGSGSQTGIGLVIKNSWLEYNFGTVVKIENTSDTCGLLHSISDTLFYDTSNVVTVNIVSDTASNRLTVRNSTFIATAAFKLDGGNAVLVNDQSYIGGTITQNDSSKYYTVDVTEVT